MQKKLKQSVSRWKNKVKHQLKGLFHFNARRPGTPYFRTAQQPASSPCNRRTVSRRRKDPRPPAAALIMAAVVILSLLPTATAANFTAWAREVLKLDVRLDGDFGLWDTFGEIRRVSGELIAPVLSGWVLDESASDLPGDIAFPARGSVVPNFDIQGGGTLEGGILIESDDGAVLSACSGTVKSIVKSAIFGDRITVLHEDGLESTYDLMQTVSVRVGDRVETLLPLGTCDRFFYFTLSQDGNLLDVSGLEPARSV